MITGERVVKDAVQARRRVSRVITFTGRRRRSTTPTIALLQTAHFAFTDLSTPLL